MTRWLATHVESPKATELVHQLATAEALEPRDVRAVPRHDLLEHLASAKASDIVRAKAAPVGPSKSQLPPLREGSL